MGGFGEDEEDDWFYDAREEISSLSDHNSDFSEDCSCSVEEINSLDVWTSNNPESVQARRRRFMEIMGFSFKKNLTIGKDSDDDSGDETQLDAERIREDSDAALRTSNSEEMFPSNQSSGSSLSNYAQGSVEKGSLEGNVDEVRNFDYQMMFVTDESYQGGMMNGLSQSGSSKSSSFGDFLNSPLHGEADEASYFEINKGKGKKSWLRKLGALTHILDRNRELMTGSSDRESIGSSGGKKKQMVRVHPYKKQFKELSSLYVGQEFSAHEGSILTMKFSLDGQYLASAGEDFVVRVWKIIENERTDAFDVPESDPSFVYFGINSVSQLEPLNAENEVVDKNKRWRKSSDSTCVILPPTVFRIFEKPLHEFRGHGGEILDLSWSNKGFLLSSSVDETVRLWQVGCNTCLGVFTHNNYVTCVAFNPVDENCFISGSIDGKVRVWDVLHCRVVDYFDIREIVTAVCYRPDGKAAIVGSLTGNCRFYNRIDGQMQLDAEIFLSGKKKLPSKRITGFQFFPSDSNKLLVTSADSQVRILCGVDVVCKLKASCLLTSASPVLAAFTSDGKHIVSATEDSSIHIWNYAVPNKISSRKTKSVQSCESFVSHNTSVAIPWCGIQSMPPQTLIPSPKPDSGQNCPYNFIRELDQKMPNFSSSDCFSLTRGFLLESTMKGSMTWPEEKLPEARSPVAAASPTICKSKFKFLRNACQNMGSSPHMWGLVIVAATWDGKIRAYHNYGLPVRL